MGKPTGYIVRPKDMKALVRQLNRPQVSLGELYGAARTLIGYAKPQQAQLPPVSVVSLALPLDEPVNVPADPDVEPQPYDMPSPEADALDRIADEVRIWLARPADILRETGRL